MKPPRRRHCYMVRPMGSEKWIECKKDALRVLREFHGKQNVKVDTRTQDRSVSHFISVEYDPQG